MFLKCSAGYELHFCTKRREQGSTIVAWYRWNIGHDFFNILNTHGRLPLEMNIDKLMSTFKEREDVIKEKDDLVKERELKLQAQFNERFKEKDLKLLDLLMETIKDKCS